MTSDEAILMMSQAPYFATMGAALCVLGLVLLTSRPHLAGRVALSLGFASLVWVSLWHLAMPWVGTSLQNQPPEAFGPLELLAINLSPAVLTWLPAALLVWLTRVGSHLRARFSVVIALLWAVGLILPDIAQDGAWAMQSIGLLLCCAVLSILLGIVYRTKRTGAH